MAATSVTDRKPGRAGRAGKPPMGASAAPHHALMAQRALQQQHAPHHLAAAAPQAAPWRTPSPHTPALPGALAGPAAPACSRELLPGEYSWEDARLQGGSKRLAGTGRMNRFIFRGACSGSGASGGGSAAKRLKSASPQALGTPSQAHPLPPVGSAAVAPAPRPLPAAPRLAVQVAGHAPQAAVCNVASRGDGALCSSPPAPPRLGMPPSAPPASSPCLVWVPQQHLQHNVSSC